MVNSKYKSKPKSEVEVALKERRDIKSLMPNFLASNDKIGNFTTNVINHLFEDNNEEIVTGFIGKKSSKLSSSDYFIPESTKDREHYQLDVGAISTDNTGEIKYCSSYIDILNELKSQGSIIDNQNRLWASQIWSWAPPINVNKIINYYTYMWCNEGTPIIDSSNDDNKTYPTDPRYALKTNAVLDIIGKPNAKIPTWTSDLNPAEGLEVKIDDSKIPVSYYIHNDITGEDITDKDGNRIEFDTWNEARDYAAQEWVDLRSGMRIRLWNDENTDYNDIVFLVQGVGSSIELVDDRIKGGNYYTYKSFNGFPEEGANDYTQRYLDSSTGYIYKWVSPYEKISEDELGEDGLGKVEIIPGHYEQTTDTGCEHYDPDYTTIERGAMDGNFWSYNNRWFPTKLFSDSIQVGYNTITARKPIIEFNKGVKLYNSGERLRIYVDLLVKDELFSTINGKTNGDTIQGVPVRDGLNILFLNEEDSLHNGKIYQISGLSLDSSMTSFTIVNTTNSSDVNGAPTTGDIVGVLSGNYKNSIYYYDGIKWIESQKYDNKSAPLFDLYDVNGTSLSNQDVYYNSDFSGNKIFSFALNENGKQKFGKYGEYMFNNSLNTEKITYVFDDQQVEYDGLRYYKEYIDGNYELKTDWLKTNWKSRQMITQEFDINNRTNNVLELEVEPAPEIAGEPTNLLVYRNSSLITKNIDYSIDGNKLTITPTLLQDGDVIAVSLYNPNNTKELINAYYNVPCELSSNPQNNNIDTDDLSYNSIFKHFSSIIENQNNFTGSPHSDNNYEDTAKLLNKGTYIIQHSAPILKTSLLNRMDYTKIRGVIEQIKDDYITVKSKFNQIADNLIGDGTIVDNSSFVASVQTILNKMNIGKTSVDAYYNSGVINNNSYIPSTPSFLGIYPLYKPEIVYIDSFVEPKSMLKGHDGALSDIYGDWRDNVMLNYELAIYNSTLDKFKRSIPELQPLQYIPGKFRTTDYSRDEYLELSQPFFEAWTSKNDLDYNTNNSYSPDDPFTWNYSNCYDKDGNLVPGHWRGIYQYYFDTEEPNKTPWEMLGFGEKPSWWEKYYGPAPYTKYNTALWNDLSDGIIREGAFKGEYNYLKRPGLIDIIPVDNNGNLLPPTQCGLIKQKPTPYFASRNWKYGDGAPIEYLWKKSSEYPFDLMSIIYLMKPAIWAETSWDTKDYDVILRGEFGEQIIDDLTQNKFSIKSTRVHNSHDEDGNLIQVIGTSQWFSDILSKDNIDIDNEFKLYINNSEPRLMYRAGAYIKPETLTVSQESFGVIPSNNYQEKLYQSSSIYIKSFSAMEIIYTGGKYKIKGLDDQEPYFRVFSPVTTSEHNKVTGSSLSAIYYNTWKDKGEKILYNSSFETIQQVYNVIIGYGKYLENDGWEFSNYDVGSNSTIDWKMMGRNFLIWAAQTDLSEGDIILLNPVGLVDDNGSIYSHIKYNGEIGIIDNVNKKINGKWSALDVNGFPMETDNYDVYREGASIYIDTKNGYQVGSLRLRTVTLEHALIFNNNEILGLYIYLPLYNEQQSRLRLSCTRTKIWDGSLYAPGYIVSDNLCIDNYEKEAHNPIDYYDIDSVLATTSYSDYAKKIMGYENTSYMQDLLLDKRSMYSFYQGMLREKGTIAAFNRLSRSQYIMDSPDDFEVYEQWAFKMGEYGDIDNRLTQEFNIIENNLNTNPQLYSYTTMLSYNVDLTTDLVDIDIDSNASGFLGDRTVYSKLPFKTNGKRWNISFKFKTGNEIKPLEYILSNYNNSNYIPNIYIEDNKLLASIPDNPNPTILGKTIINDVNIPYQLNDKQNWTLRIKTSDLLDILRDSSDIININGTCTTILSSSSLDLDDYSKDNRIIIYKYRILEGENSGKIICRLRFNGLLDPSYPTFNPVQNIPNGIDIELNEDLEYIEISLEKISNLFPIMVYKLPSIEIVSYKDKVDSIILSENTGYKVSLSFDGVSYKLLVIDDNKNEFVFTKNAIGVIGDDNSAIMNFGGRGFNVENIDYFGGSINLNSIMVYIDGNKFINGGIPDGSPAFLDTFTSNQLDQVIMYNDTRWNSKNLSKNYNRFFKVEDNNTFIQYLPYIPLVRVDDADYTIENKDKLQDLYENKNLKSTDKIWITFEDNVNGFDVKQLKPILTINSIEYDEEVDIATFGNSRFITSTPHNLKVGDKIIINSNQDKKQSYDGEQEVTYIVNEYTFKINQNIQITDLFTDTPKPTIHNFISRIYNNVPDIKSYDEEGDIVFVNRLKLDASLLENFDIDPNKKTYSIWKFHNGAWVLDRVQERKIDTAGVHSILLYNKDSGNIEATLQPFDPYKMVMNEDALDEIEYLTEYDPAIYKIDQTIDQQATINIWYSKNVGKLWWDLSTFKLLDYELGDIEYKRKYWGKQVLGSTVDIYEWVKSPVHPSEYNNYVTSQQDNNDYTLSGTVKTTEIDGVTYYKYSTKVEFDKKSNEYVTYYYFWVKEPIYTPKNSFRKLSANTVKQKLFDVFTDEVSYIEFIDVKKVDNQHYSSTFLIGNIENIINDNSSILQINYKRRSDEDVPHHKQWVLTKENSDENIPFMIWDRFKDSICGLNEEGEVVPDPLLSENSKYGIQIRPRQSMFNDLYMARRDFVYNTNNIFSGICMSSTETGWENIFKASQMPILTLDMNNSGDKEIYENPSENFIYFVFKMIGDDGEDVYRKIVNTDGTNYSWEDAVESEYMGYNSVDIKNKGSIHICENKAERNEKVVGGDFLIGDYIYTKHDTLFNNKWSIYRLDDVNTLTYITSQFYDVEDYWSFVDWYNEEICNSNSVAQHEYETTTERDMDLKNIKEGDLVLVKDDGAGYWFMSQLQYSDTGLESWPTVAYEKGTIKLNDKFYNFDISDYNSDEYKKSAYVLRIILKFFESKKLGEE